MSDFIKQSEKIAFDLKHRKTIKFNMSRYDAAVEQGKKQYVNLEKAKQRASYIKEKAVYNLYDYILEFEKNFTANGGKVIWAENTNQTIKHVLEILQAKQAKMIVKSKSMTTEEIEFNDALEKNNIESVETDLGEYIVQLAGEKPYHIVTPAMHKSKQDVADLFNEKFNTPIDSSPEFLTLFVRDILRKKFVSADVGVTGGNFLVADIGGVAVTENEGNAIMSTSFPKTHIAIVGIEKIIPSINDFYTMWPILSTHGTGQNITAYNSIFTGPKKADEIDGPEEMYVILLDNGRADLLNNQEQNEVLKCIRCGACLNACPVYRNIGGYTYETTYSGPIGSVITPHYKGMDKYKHLSFACTLCGKCTEVCPEKINLHHLLILNRRDAVENTKTSMLWDLGMKGYEKGMLNRNLLDAFGGGMKNFGVNLFGKKMWGPYRDLPKVAKQSFSKQWKKQHKK